MRAAGVLVVASGVDALGMPIGSKDSVQHRLEAASVAIDDGNCTGVVAEDPRTVVTVRHCVATVGRRLRVRSSEGTIRGARVVAIDRRADQAVLRLDSPARVQPLAIRRSRPHEGARLLFEGNPLRPRLQSARLVRIGRCPSLPEVSNALFTTIRGAPGDSGAPVLDASGEIVGLVHGGARCHILTPGDSLWRLVARAGPARRDSTRLENRGPAPRSEMMLASQRVRDSGDECSDH